jgi:hypothetical protein
MLHQALTVSVRPKPDGEIQLDLFLNWDNGCWLAAKPRAMRREYGSTLADVMVRVLP